MTQPFMTRVQAPIVGVIPKKVDVQMWITGVNDALKAVKRERPQTENAKRDHAHRLRKLKVMLAEFEELKTIMD